MAKAPARPDQDLSDNEDSAFLDVDASEYRKALADPVVKDFAWRGDVAAAKLEQDLKDA